ncbi:hypothetical protein CRG98_015042 [Punica granatum]|uniref:Uncharacterized protein n=1 Tax=Punica granatum TaxID=22663 RepID=A0A2I0K8U4_PUNGR|nr:hypothetical protein CRG98_015042 [Punica granatum]
MCSARECPYPSEESSSSENEIVLEKIVLMVSSICSRAVSLGTCAAVRTLRSASRCGSELRSRASSEMWAGDLPICSTILYSLALMIFMNAFASSFRVLVHLARACHPRHAYLVFKIADTALVRPWDTIILVWLIVGDIYDEWGRRYAGPRDPTVSPTVVKGVTECTNMILATQMRILICQVKVRTRCLKYDLIAREELPVLEPRLCFAEPEKVQEYNGRFTVVRATVVEPTGL